MVVRGAWRRKMMIMMIAMKSAGDRLEKDQVTTTLVERGP
jgi:hypothetical protein